MSTPSRFLVSLTLILALTAGAPAAERLDSRRDLPGADRYFALPDGREPLLGTQGLGAGKPGRLAALSSWVTSDLLPDDFSTDTLWFENETLLVFMWFYTERDREVQVSLVVRNQSGAVAFADSFSDSPLLGQPSGFFFNLGFLVPGLYQIQVRFKQGKSTAGLRYWIRVSPFEDTSL